MLGIYDTNLVSTQCDAVKKGQTTELSKDTAARFGHIAKLFPSSLNEVMFIPPQPTHTVEIQK